MDRVATRRTAGLAHPPSSAASKKAQNRDRDHGRSCSQEVSPLRDSNRAREEPADFNRAKEQPARRTSYSGKDVEVTVPGKRRAEENIVGHQLEHEIDAVRKHVPSSSQHLDKHVPSSSQHLDKRGKHVPTNLDRMEVAFLREELRRKEAMLQAMQRTTEMALKVSPLGKPDYQDVKVFSKAVSDIVMDVMLAFTFFPDEGYLKDEIVRFFAVNQNDKAEFDKHWRSSLRRRTLDAARSKRSFFTKLLRETLYGQLDCHKPGKGESLELWRKKLADIRSDDRWREVVCSDSGILDPWGSEAVVATLRTTMHTPRSSDLVHMNMAQAKFLFYVMQLAIEGRTLVCTQMEEHREEINSMEETILTWMQSMQRISISVDP